MNNNNKKNVLVTGSSKGIGLAIAKKFATNGHKVAINSRSNSDLELLCKHESNFLAVHGDVTSEIISKNIVDKVHEKLGSLDIVVCNVGNGKSVKPGLENLDEWKRSLSLNLFSATNVIEASRKYLSKSKGNIVCISSICALEVIDGAPLTYSVAKSALNYYIKCISRTLAKDGIRINGITPGNILFEGSVWEEKLKKDKFNVENYLKDNVPLNTFGTPEDIANIVFYISSSQAKFVTGSIWCADGGQIKS